MGGSAKVKEGKQSARGRIHASTVPVCGEEQEGPTYVSGYTKEFLDIELDETLEEKVAEINLVVGEFARRRHGQGGFGRATRRAARRLM